jgi:hypothetical protein
VDLNAYRAQAEAFTEELTREYLLHFSGRKDEFEIEPIYDRHAALFSREAIDPLRDSSNRELLRFAVEGHIGQAVKSEEAELARREAALTVSVDGGEMPYRQAPVIQANEPDPDRRAAIDTARNEVLERELNPLIREATERSHALARDLGWTSMRALCEELGGIDLDGLDGQTEAFLAETESAYEPAVEPELERHIALGFEGLRRSDLPAFFRATALDGVFPADRLLDALQTTLAGLGLEGGGAGNVIIDADERPKKSPRAFCAPVLVPSEVHLVIPRVGGRDDYDALMHEAGHAEHYAHVDVALQFEHRQLGDNSVTEGFAFLMEHLTTDAAWLEDVLGADDDTAQAVRGHAHATRLVFLRRYCAKLSYELELHGGGDLDAMRGVYARRLSDALHVDWPSATWLSDVDPFYYSARYLRAWAFETHLRALLRERFGERWFADGEAGATLRDWWSRGQAAGADELLAELTGARLDFSVLLEDLALA